MTPQERIAMMDRTISRENEEARIKAQKAEEERQKYMAKIRGMADRIKAIIEVGEVVRQRNAMPYVDMLEERYHMDKVFVANGWSHRVGFMGHMLTPIEYIGCYAGGACGPWDFYTNGEVVFDQHEKTGATKEPTTGEMKQFIEGFDDFEQRFYTWFDKRFGKDDE